MASCLISKGNISVSMHSDRKRDIDSCGEQDVDGNRRLIAVPCTFLFSLLYTIQYLLHWKGIYIIYTALLYV
jgi:hypothetical protein